MKPTHKIMFNLSMRGDVIVHQGLELPAFFVGVDDIDDVFAIPARKAPRPITSAYSVFMLWLLLDDTSNFAPLFELPEAFPNDTPAIRFILKNDLRVAYVDHPQAVHFVDWFASHRVQLLITPRNVRVTAASVAPSDAELWRVAGQWDDQFRVHGKRQLEGAERAWSIAHAAYQKL